MLAACRPLRDNDVVEIFLVDQRIEELCLTNLHRLECTAQSVRQRGLRRIGGPHCEHTARPNVGGQASQTFRRVECGVRRVEQELRRVIDIEQDGMIPLRSDAGGMPLTWFHMWIGEIGKNR